MAGVDRTTRFSLAASLLAVLVSVGISRVFASKVAAPLAHLSTEMEKVGRFELEATEVPSSMFPSSLPAPGSRRGTCSSGTSGHTNG